MENSNIFHTLETATLFVELIKNKCIIEDSRFTFFDNPQRWTSLLGWPLKTLYSKPVLDFVHPKDREIAEKAMNDSLDNPNKIIEGVTLRFVRKSEKIIILRWTGQSNGKRIIAICENLTPKAVAIQEELPSYLTL